ncbi:MAG: zinc ABC transporter substrate-binding protein [Yoonia sp.]|uniref:zinc ABC transporter substrate-binding protein n=1 Tax=Yoonia sp. TaxID=2212373 RepID=UPI00273DE187|nr:zinc ABC transporter substrate-binding protein [Yoonia sp.]MDP5084334.1 zinc ABC transporter substrate-binding protein [Yoonia sp.]
MIRLLAVLATLPAAALAEVPRVITDIAPIHSLTAQVMGDLGTPDVLLPPGADPHDFALRPSDAARLGEADLVIWVGDGLTPWLEEPLDTLAPEARKLSLLETEGWDKLEIRELKAMGDDDGHNHDHDHGHSHDHGHDHGHDHDHGSFDPHAWLDPVAAQAWVGEIAAALSAQDPANAATYAQNAATATSALAALEQQITAQLAGLTDRAYILPHDGYQYFEARFGLTAAGALSGIDAQTPGPAQVAALRDLMAEDAVVCVFSDAEIGDRWATLVTESTTAKTASLDGVGVGLTEGPALYDAMITRLADSFESCLR